MWTRSVAVKSSLLKTNRAPSLLNSVRHQWIEQSQNRASLIPRSPSIATVRRSYATRNDIQPKIHGQTDDDPGKRHNPNSNSIPEDLTPGKSIQDALNSTPQTGKLDRMRQSKHLPGGHVSSLEEITHRLNKWLDPIMRSPEPDPTQQYMHVAQDIYVSHTRPQNSTYGLTVIIDRITKANALSTKLMADLTMVFEAIESLQAVAAVSLASATLYAPPRSKRIFSAGADLNELKNLDTPAQAEDFIRTVSRLCNTIRDLSVPVIAQIDGPCFGAALEIAASCDIRYASKIASFAMPEVNLGIPSVVQARLLCDIVGWARARELMLTGNVWNADQALEFGLVSGVYGRLGNLIHHTNALMSLMSRRPHAYKSQKLLMRKWETCSIDQGIEAGVSAFVDIWRNEEAKGQAKTAMEGALVKKSRRIEHDETADDEYQSQDDGESPRSIVRRVDNIGPRYPRRRN